MGRLANKVGGWQKTGCLSGGGWTSIATSGIVADSGSSGNEVVVVWGGVMFLPKTIKLFGLKSIHEDYTKKLRLKRQFIFALNSLWQCFPTFCCSRHLSLVIKQFGGTPSWFNRYKDQGIVTIDGTPGTSSRHLVYRGIPVGNHCSSRSRQGGGSLFCQKF